MVVASHATDLLSRSSSGVSSSTHTCQLEHDETHAMMQDNAQLERREPADRSSTGSTRSGLPPHPAFRVAKDPSQSQPPANTESFVDEYGDDDIYLAYAADPEEVPQENNSKIYLIVKLFLIS